MFRNFFTNYKRLTIIIGIIFFSSALIVSSIIFINAKKNYVPKTETSSIKQVVASSEESSVPEVPVDNGIRLVLNLPTKNEMTVTDPLIAISGSSDPGQPLKLNGADLERNDRGSFAFDTQLTEGKNTFTFEHKGEVQVYTVYYRYVVINAYNPAKATTFNSGDSFVATVAAHPGSTVTATFNGATIPLNEGGEILSDSGGQTSGGGFKNFTGVFVLPADNATNLSLGRIKYTATYNGRTETFSSGNITLRKSNFMNISDPSVTPPGDEYMDVGSGYIAEVVMYNAETFNGKTTDDFSRPTNNYLPKGTVDYCSRGTLTTSEGKYTKLRCGRRVYTDSKGSSIIRQYDGTLPDHNEIGVSSVNEAGRYTTLTLDTMWKAPFYLDVKPQGYADPPNKEKPSYAIGAPTYNYVDITFCYTTVLNGEVVISPENPIFRSAEIIKNNYDYTIRLHLKKTGGFYGWDSYYNEAGQLVFEFLNPARVTLADNGFGARLDGTRIFVDAGHGGTTSTGAVVGTVYEKNLNLTMAQKLKNILQNLGATVIMSREGDQLVDDHTRMLALKNAKPDYAVSIHQNSSPSSAANGFQSFHFNPFSKLAADYIYQQNKIPGVYNQTAWSGVNFHYFFLARTSNCPVVLTENGFMSNSFDFANMQNDAIAERKANAIAKGIVEYFTSIQ